MVGSQDSVPVNDDNSTSSSPSSAVSCSICLDLVSDHEERSIAKLQCGHEFHLDCIGSAFNMKGAMQCPNCRKVEKGGWLFANNSTPSIPQISEVDWTHNVDPFHYSEMPFGVPWCPFGGFTVQSAFEELESLSSTSSSSMAGSYFAYLRPIPASVSNSNENLDDPNFNHRLNNAHTFPTTYIPHQGWIRPPLSANGRFVDGGDQALAHPPTQRSTRIWSDPMARSGSFAVPFRYSHGRNPQLHSSITSSINPGFRRFSFTRGWPMAVPSIRTGGFPILPPSGFSGRTLHDPENSLPNQHIHGWERNQPLFPVISSNTDPGWGPLHHIADASNHSNRSSSSWPPQWS